MSILPPSKRIYRGEVRKVFPTPEYPDPAQGLRDDPEGFLRHWMSPNHPWPVDQTWMRGPFEVPSVGQHWSGSPEIIPERFAIEHLARQPQQGKPMGRKEKTAVTRQDYVDSTDYPYEERETLARYEAYLKRADKEGINRFRDLSGGDLERPDRAKKFSMSVVWHGRLPDDYDIGTNYEDEFDLPKGSKVQVEGARVHISPAGTTHDFSQHYPSTFTSEERAAANNDAWNRSGYSRISPESPVPWSRVQFKSTLEMPVDRPRGLR